MTEVFPDTMLFGSTTTSQLAIIGVEPRHSFEDRVAINDNAGSNKAC